MPFDVHTFQVRIGTDGQRQSRLWRARRGVRFDGAARENPACPADFRVRDWNGEIVRKGISRSAADSGNDQPQTNTERLDKDDRRRSQVDIPAPERRATNKKHDLEQAISALLKRLNEDPTAAGDAYRSISAHYADLGRAWEAAAAARKALEYDPFDDAFRTWMKERTPGVINILRAGAIGDVLATSAVTAQLAARIPDVEIHYYTKMPDMAKLLIGVHKVCDADAWARREPGADLNLIGYPIAEGYPERPMRKHLTEYFCDEARLPPGLPRLQEDLHPFDIGGRWITIHPRSGWSVYKEWGLDKWNEIVRRIHRNYSDIAVVQVGGAGDPCLEGLDWDLRGRTSLSQTLWLVKHSALHMGCDTFTNHAAGAFGHTAVIVFGSTSPTGSGYGSAVNLWAGLGCSPCYRENPRISRQSRGPCINPPGQEYDRPQHACMAAVAVETVWGTTDLLLSAHSATNDHKALATG